MESDTAAEQACIEAYGPDYYITGISDDQILFGQSAAFSGPARWSVRPLAVGGGCAGSVGAGWQRGRMNLFTPGVDEVHADGASVQWVVVHCFRSRRISLSSSRVRASACWARASWSS